MTQMADKGRYAVIGLGVFGRSVASTLMHMGYEVLAVDADPEVVAAAQNDDVATHVVQADVHNASALEELDIDECEKVLVAIGTNLEASILAVLNLIDLKVPYILAKATSDMHARVLKRLGGRYGDQDIVVDVVRPEVEMGIVAAQRLIYRAVVESITLDPEHSFVEIDVPSDLVGKSVAHSGLRNRYNALLLTIARGDKTIIVPEPNETLAKGDKLVLLGTTKLLKQLASKLEGFDERQKQEQKVYPKCCSDCFY